MPQIKDLGTEKTDPSDTDIIPLQEASGATRRITRANFLKGINAGSATTPTTFNCWRVRNTVSASGSDAQWIVRELSFLNSNLVNITTGGFPIAIQYNTLRNAFDANFNTFWAGAGNFAVDAWIGYKFASTIQPAYLIITNLNNGTNVPPTQYAIDKSSDGINWIQHQTFSLNTTENSQQITIN